MLTKEMRKPNVLFVFPDQWRRMAVGYRKEDEVSTPNIDHFAEQSVVLENAISCFPLCSPNRSVMLTGRYPLSTGVTTNCKLGLNVKLNDDEVTIGMVLKEAGYQTGYIGKWHLDVPEQVLDPEPASGARHWDAYIPPGPRRFGFDYWYSYNAYNQHLSPHYWRDTPEMIEPGEWSTQHETDAAIEFIRNRDDSKPFCLFVSWNPPHQPFDQVPERYKAMYAGKPLNLRPNVIGEGVAEADRHLHDYFAAVTATDDQFGRLLELLKEEGIADNTIVVLTSDHGETMGAHGWLENKNIWYEESIGVPFFIRYPGCLKPRTEKLLFNSSDIAPTLLGLLDIPAPKRMVGMDYSSVFRGEAGEVHSSAFICHYPGGLEEHKRAQELGIDVNAYGWRGIRSHTHTYVVSRSIQDSTVKRLLYDNVQDPFQLNPVEFSGISLEGIAMQMEQQLKNWLKKLRDPFILE